MAHANIYIRKENEARWGLITDKSAWVNAMLEKSPPNSKVIEQKLEPEPIYVSDPDLGDPSNQSGTPRSGLEPLYRNKKKGKI
jgi:hypothetical protein